MGLIVDEAKLAEQLKQKFLEVLSSTRPSEVLSDSIVKAVSKLQGQGVRVKGTVSGVSFDLLVALERRDGGGAV